MLALAYCQSEIISMSVRMLKGFAVVCAISKVGHVQ